MLSRPLPITKKATKAGSQPEAGVKSESMPRTWNRNLSRPYALGEQRSVPSVNVSAVADGNDEDCVPTLIDAEQQPVVTARALR
jgi:hypothetical protein